MITKFRKLQDTWFAKGILILTGLSFVSLFGVAGYMGSVGKNRPVIKVDGYELLQSEAYAQLDKEINVAKKLFGDTFEVSDTVRLGMLQDIVQKNLNNMIIRNMAKKNNVSISDNLVRQVIYSQPEFRGADGRFDLNRLRQILSASDWTEQQYIDSIRQDIVKQSIVQTPVEGINIPQVLLKYAAKINNQKRVFKYISLNTQTLPIERKISEDEVLQYYQDFNLNFMAPETRDVSFFYLSNDMVEKLINISDADAEEYYRQNQAQFETPATRKVLQMVFDNEKAAADASAELAKGADFYAVAAKSAKQSKADTDLGFVAKDMLLEELAEPIFSAAQGTVLGPIQTGMGWHVVKVEALKAGSKTEKSKALAQIKDHLKKERMYDEAYALAADMEDKAGAGSSLEDIAAEMKAAVHKVKNLQENGTAAQSDANLKKVISAPDFIDMAFSYNAGEISQVIELDDGFALLRVDSVYDTHPKELAEVRPEIVKMWQANERAAIAQEITNDVLHDLENGDSIDEVASRFKLNLKSTAAISRNQPFAELTAADMNDLFLEKVGTPRIFNNGDKEIIAVTADIINSAADAKSDDAVLRQVKLDLSQEYANRLLSDFSSDYDVRVKYRLLGLAD